AREPRPGAPGTELERRVRVPARAREVAAAQARLRAAGERLPVAPVQLERAAEGGLRLAPAPELQLDLAAPRANPRGLGVEETRPAQVGRGGAQPARLAAQAAAPGERVRAARVEPRGLVELAQSGGAPSQGLERARPPHAGRGQRRIE